MEFLYDWRKRLLVSEIHNEYFTRHILKQFFEWLNLTGQFAQLLLQHCDFLDIDISQGNVATYLRRDGICCKCTGQSVRERILKIG